MKKKTKKIKINQSLFIKFLKCLVFLFLKLKLHYKVKNKYIAQKGEKLFVLSNHQTDYDPIFMWYHFNRFFYTVGTDNILARKLVSKILYFFGMVPKRKGKSDMKMTMRLFEISRGGGSIVLFPEGNRTFAEFQFYIDKDIVKLIKKFSHTLVLFNIHGGFGRYPRFANKARRGQFYGEIKRVLKPEEYQKMSDDELYELIKDNLKVFDYESHELYKSHKKAEYLERMFFVCPKCHKMQLLESRGNKIYCRNCSFEATYNEDLTLSVKDKSINFKHLVDWYDYQRKFVKEYKLNNEFIFIDKDCCLSLVNENSKKPLLEMGELLCLDQNILKIGRHEFDIHKIEIASPMSKRKLLFTYGEDNYEIKGNEKFNALKYVLMFNRLDTKMKLDKIDHYFTLED